MARARIDLLLLVLACTASAQTSELARAADGALSQAAVDSSSAAALEPFPAASTEARPPRIQASQKASLIIGPIEDLLIVKRGRDVLLTWLSTPEPALYDVWYVEYREEIPEASPGHLSNPVGRCAALSVNRCIDPAAAGPNAGTVRYYQVGGNSPGGGARE